MRRLLAVVATLVFASYSDSTAPKELLRINVLPDALELLNTSRQPV